jgi:hypothetical protein
MTMSSFYPTDLDAYYAAADEADPRDVFEGTALRDLHTAASDLYRMGWNEQEIAAEIIEAMPLAEEIADETAPAVAPPF